MRGAKVRLCYGIVLLAVSLCWSAGEDLSPQPGPKRSPHSKSIALSDGKFIGKSDSDNSVKIAEEIRRRVSAVTDDVEEEGNTFAEKTSVQDDFSKPSDDETNKRLTSPDNRIFDETSVSNKAEDSSRSSYDEHKADLETIALMQAAIQNVTNKEETQKESFMDTVVTKDAKDMLFSSGSPWKKESAKSSSGVDSSSTEPQPAESKVVREFRSRRKEEAPFVTTARGGNSWMTTLRSTKVEEVTEYEDEEEGSDEIKEKKKKPTGSSKEAKDYTTLRTGKILAGQKPYDGLLGQLSSGTNRKSAFQSHGDYNPLDSYPSSGGVYRKPITGYFDSSLSNTGSRKPSPHDVRKPLYSLDSTYGAGLSGLSTSGLQRRPFGDSTTPFIRPRPVHDFSIGPAGKNPFLSGGVNSIPSLSTSAVASSSKRPFSGLPSGLTEGLSAFADPGSPGLMSRPEVSIRIRKPVSPLGEQPFSRPSSLSRPELEGGFRPVLASNYNELPSEGTQQNLPHHQAYKHRVKPVRGPQGESASLPGAFNFNNIGLNMLYKETNVLNNQDFTSSGGGEGVSVSSSAPPLSQAGDSNQLESSGTAVSEGSEVSGGLVKKITRTRVKQEHVEDADDEDKPEAADDSLTTTEVIPVSPSSPSQTKYKLRKPVLLTNSTRKSTESNAIPQEVTSRKPVVKNNLKSRLTPGRTKVPSNASPVTTTTMSATTEIDDELEATTQIPFEAESIPSAMKPIIGFNQRKRPPGKHNSPSAEATMLPPVKVSTNTRLRRPVAQSEAPTTPVPVKKIKPFVNWASRLQKPTTTEEDSSEEVTTLPDEEVVGHQGGAVTPETLTSIPAYVITSTLATDAESPSLSITPGVAGHDAIRTSQSTWPTQSTTPSDSKDDIITTTAKLFENTIPSNKILEENNSYNKLPSVDEMKKDDGQFTVKDFISKFDEDSSNTDGDSLEHIGHVEHSFVNTNDTSEPPLKVSSESDLLLTSKTAVTSPSSPSLDSSTQSNQMANNQITTMTTTLSNLLEVSTEQSLTEVAKEVEPGSTEVNKSIKKLDSGGNTNVAGPVEKPPVEKSPVESLDNVDLSEDPFIEDLVTPSSERTQPKEKRIEDTSDRKVTESTTEDKEQSSSSRVDLRSDKIGNRINGDNSIGVNATSDHVPERIPTKLNETRSESSLTTQKTNSTNHVSTTEEEGSPDFSRSTSTQKTHSTVKAVSKPNDRDPWDTNFSEDLWTNFDSTTDLWKPSRKPALARPSKEESPATTVKKTIGSKELGEDVISKEISSKDSSKEISNGEIAKKDPGSKEGTPSKEDKDVRIDSKERDGPNTSDGTDDPVLSSVSVTPPTEATTKKPTTKIMKTSTAPTVTTRVESVSIETNKQSPVNMATDKLSTSTKQTPQLHAPATSEEDFYGGEEIDPAGSPPIVLPPHAPPIEDPKHYIQLAIHSTPADICASLPAIGQSIISLFQMGSLRVQSPEQMRVKNRDLLCTSPETQESQIFVEFYLTDGMGQFDRDINEEFVRLYSKQGGLETDLMITDAHLIGEEPIPDDILTTDDNTITPRPGTPPRVIAAIVLACVAVFCLIGIIVLLFIMRKKGRSFNNRQRCIPVSLDDYSLDNVSVYNSTRRKSRLRASKRSYGNPGFDDPDIPTNPMAFAALALFARDRRAIEEEFAAIPSISVRPDELPPGVEDKNRYANVIPIPETRVRLCAPGENVSSVDDYINANYVRGPKNQEKFYIACQAPLQNTIEDFWHMVWTHQSKVILMITGLFENSVEKCADYLPPSEVLDCHRVFGDYQITLKRREVREKYVISNLQIKNLETNLWRELTHVWYTSWPTTGVPAEENSLIAFLIEARAHTKEIGGGRDNQPPPIVVHCSPGTGRTGTVLACDLVIRQFETSRIVNVPNTVYNIRRCRAGLVATPQQYAFIYRVINVYATKLTGGPLESF